MTDSTFRLAKVADTTYADMQRALARASRATPFGAAAFLAMHRAVNEIVTVDGEDGIQIYIGDSTGTPDLTEMWAASDWRRRTPDWIKQVRALLEEEKAPRG
ncbi:hypothetical protein GCM10007874_17550 [Labrys miyagiensis]|uniref:Uncharacterized protein n=1 Tax=Labrys miyagiensis TaxID=346912 RepID=A0ABQ6CEE0_9HYPH|nr:hypothetical protein [Labrys miyagiensis]GLS18738.1 hypothetical protein GCM10007874_17550 [Labrys miyagiensis]